MINFLRKNILTSCCNKANDGSQKNGHLYIHYYNWEGLELISGFNAGRILQRKKPYPVIVAAVADQENLFKLRDELRSIDPKLIFENHHTGLPRIIDNYLAGKILLDDQQSFDPEMLQHVRVLAGVNEPVLIATYHAIEAMEVTVGLAKLTNQDKLYLLGHGRGGFDSVTDGNNGHKWKIKEYAMQLKAAHLSKQIHDIRVMWCESANHKTHIKEVAIPPLRLLKKNAQRSFFRKKLIPAQKLSSQLTKLGYKDIQVSGYQGFGRKYPSMNNLATFSKPRFMEMTSIYKPCLDKPKSHVREETFSDMRQASTIKKIYKNGKKI